jgi:hypothetical protein
MAEASTISLVAIALDLSPGSFDRGENLLVVHAGGGQLRDSRQPSIEILGG